MHNIFLENWKSCLLEHYKALIAENRNIAGIQEALALAGFTESDIQSAFIQSTSDNPTKDQIEIAKSFIEQPNSCLKPVIP